MRIGEACQSVKVEPLIGRNLFADFSDILQVIGWICPRTREWARANSPVQKVVRERPR